jgi:hypothetical protein
MPDTPFQEVTWFSCIRFCSSSANFFPLVIEYEQKGHKVTPGANSKVIMFEFLTTMNVSTAVIWDVRPCTSMQRANVSEVRCPYFQNLPICCSEQFVTKFLPMLVSIHQATWQHILQ